MGTYAQVKDLYCQIVNSNIPLNNFEARFVMAVGAKLEAFREHQDKWENSQTVYVTLNRIVLDNKNA